MRWGGASRAGALCALLCAAGCGHIRAQTRAEEIQLERRQKAARLKPDKPGAIERIVAKALGTETVERHSPLHGLSLKFGGLVSGSGFALGPQYKRDDLADGRVLFRASARWSFRKYQFYDAGLWMPRLASDRAFVWLYAAHRDYPSLNYYGPGPKSVITGRSDYDLTDTSVDAGAAVRPFPKVRLGVTGGFLSAEVGPGRDSRFASADRNFSPAVTPGLDVQSNFLRAGLFAVYDGRDRPADPHRGGRYAAKHLFYSDRTFDRYSFHRTIAEAEHYFAFFNQRRVIALHGKTELSGTDGGNLVPFFLQPVLGGSEDLRGFRPFRFYDDNLVVLNAEYRWEIFTGLDMAIFTDHGKVFHRRGDLDFSGLEHAYGLGFRVKTRDAVFLRVDSGFSREGFQVWLKFNNIFGQGGEPY